MSEQRVGPHGGPQSGPTGGPDGSRHSYLGDGYRTPVDRVHGRPSRAVYRRRRLVVGILALVLVAAVVLFLGLVWPGFWRDAAVEPAPQTAVTTTAPAPTPTVEPMERADDETAFQQALPSTVLQFALVAQATSEPTLDAGAVEAWTAEYGDGGRTVSVVAGQWATDQDAGAAAEALLEAAGEATAEGEVMVGDEVVGTYAVTSAADAGAAVVTWRNGTAVFQATGPAEVVEAFYAAFPL